MHNRFFRRLLGSALALTAGAAIVINTLPAEAGGVVDLQIIEPSLSNPLTWTYTPDGATVRVGDTLVWTNVGAVPHSVTADDGSFDSGILMGGDTWSYTPSVGGTFAYYCSLHPAMRATVIVAE